MPTRKARPATASPKQLGVATPPPSTPSEALLERIPNPHPDKRYLARFAVPEGVKQRKRGCGIPESAERGLQKAERFRILPLWIPPSAFPVPHCRFLLFPRSLWRIASISVDKVGY